MVMNTEEIGVIIARVSTKGQEDEGYSLEAQVKKSENVLRQYANQSDKGV